MELGDEEARRKAWDYLDTRYLAYARGGGEGQTARFGPISHEHVEEGRGELIRYHGNKDHEFVVHNRFEELGTREWMLALKGVRASLEVTTEPF